MRLLITLLLSMTCFASSGQGRDKVADLIKTRLKFWESKGWQNVVVSESVYKWSQSDALHKLSVIDGDSSTLSKGLRKSLSLLRQNLTNEEIQGLADILESFGDTFWQGDILAQVNSRQFEKQTSKSTLLISEPIFVNSLIILKEKIYNDHGSYGGTILLKQMDDMTVSELGYIDISVVTSN